MRSPLLLTLGFVCLTVAHAQTTATPTISLATGTYTMPQNTTISDGTSGASILWCYTGVGTCTPATSYSGSIYVDPTATETICANATASGHTQSATACAYYTNAASVTATPVISLPTGTYTMPQNTTISDGTSGASILWCYTGTGTCTPSTAYSGSIYINPTSTETICANATASGHSPSGTTCAYYTTASTPTATPVITLATGTYTMPQNTTITDGTSGASILWCYTGTGTCTPSTAYSGSIYVNPASTETICAYATASGHTQSSTVCNYYTASSGNGLNISYSNGQVTITTTLNADIFYTTDGSTATEASIKYEGPFAAPSGTTVKAVAVQMTSNGYTGVAVQNGQTSAGDWKTNLACHQSQCAPYVGYYTNPPALNYAPTSTDNTTSSGALGVQGIPTQLAMTTGQVAPTALGGATTANFNFTTQGYPNSSINGTGCNTKGQCGTAAYFGTQALWPYNTGSTGCDTCTSLVEDFYIWPGQNAGSVQNWELDMNSWVTLGNGSINDVYRGASMQCSINDGTWDYNGQNGSWYKFKDVVSSGYNHDCPLPTGTITAALNTSSCSFSVTPNATNSTVEPGMILWFKDNDEQVFVTSASGNSVTGCKRGYAGTTAAAHNSGAAYSGSVHVQYHVTFIPGYTGSCKLRQDPSTPTECVYIDYLKVNNFDVFNKSSYGTMTVDGQTVSKLYVDADTMSPTWPDRVFDQKQIDVAPSVGSTNSPVQVGEYVDQDNVTSSFGVLATQSYTVP